MIKRHFSRTLPGLLACLLLANGAFAQGVPGDAAAGYQFAMSHCAACHIVTVNQTPPRAIAVPSFFEVSRTKGVTELSLRVFLQSNHNRMPNFILDRTDVENVISYILSLRDLPVPKPPAKAPPEPRGKDAAGTRL